MLKQQLMVKLAGLFVNPCQAFALFAAFYLVCRDRLFFDLHPDFFSEPANRIGKAHSLHTHQKREDIATDATPETVENLP